MHRSIIILGIAMCLFVCCTGQIQAAHERAYVAGNYYLMLNNTNCGFVKSVDGGAISAEVINEPAGAEYFVKKHIGQPKYEDISIQIGFSMNKSIYDWIGQSWTASSQAKSGKVVVCDFNLMPKSEKQFFDAFITETTIPACDGSSKEPAYITLTFSPERTISTATNAAAGKSDYGKNEQEIWLPCNFQLNIDGLDCSKVNMIDSFTIKQSVITDDIGDARDFQKEPGKLEFPNLKITLPEGSAQSWVDWHDNFVIKGNNDDGHEKNGTLVFLSPNRQTELARIKFFNMGIVSLESSKYEANADQLKRVTAEIYCERMEFDTSQSGIQSSATPAETQVLPPSGKGGIRKNLQHATKPATVFYFTKRELHCRAGDYGQTVLYCEC